MIKCEINRNTLISVPTSVILFVLNVMRDSNEKTAATVALTIIILNINVVMPYYGAASRNIENVFNLI